MRNKAISTFPTGKPISPRVSISSAYSLMHHQESFRPIGVAKERLCVRTLSINSTNACCGDTFPEANQRADFISILQGCLYFSRHKNIWYSSAAGKEVAAQIVVYGQSQGTLKLYSVSLGMMMHIPYELLRRKEGVAIQCPSQHIGEGSLTKIILNREMFASTPPNPAVNVIPYLTTQKSQ